ncbi:uncharacterized protein DUF3558 [Actinocrispum wychmicini]|uniref:Uncharacterized protein DUF3558 n=2 Tax=Actinocrispum wychmicini TaxID=1213861 RepID=A0A4R2JT28_9PSEU|nr:uncharacterized protein DUF3558 [Actinocrispum wychmicini]
MAAGLTLVSVLTAACGQKIGGVATADPQAVVNTSTSETASPPTSNPLDGPPASGTPAMEQKLCKLLTFDDLPFKNQGANVTEPKSDVNISTDFDQSCRWTYQLAQQGLKVGVQLYYRKTQSLAVKNPNGTYTVAGRPVLYQQADDTSCVLSLKYADGNVGIGVIDASKLFGPQCEVGKHVAEAIIGREPQTLS